jgi:hypothetical protein
MKYVDQLAPETLNRDILAYTREYLETLKSFYTRTFKAAVNKINEITQSFHPEDLRELERNYGNKTLEEFVTNKKTFDYFIEHKGDMIQIKDPIYRDPTHRFIKAHFYAPRKMLAGRFIPTLWVNVLVIWFMTIILYVLLYYRVLKKFLDYTERLTQKNRHQPSPHPVK